MGQTRRLTRFLSSLLFTVNGTFEGGRRQLKLVYNY